jgi:hypothetical protein
MKFFFKKIKKKRGADETMPHVQEISDYTVSE